MKICVAYDEAFNFLYRPNIDVFSRIGEVVSFSPLRDETLPSCDMLYLPGGYPELFVEDLEANTSMRKSVRNFVEKEGFVWAECGGFMYLCHQIDHHEMCGVLPLDATMADAHLHLGYRQMEWNGRQIKGHEFHYSKVKESFLPETFNIITNQFSAKGIKVDTPVYRYKNMIAGYTHWYWAELFEQILHEGKNPLEWLMMK